MASRTTIAPREVIDLMEIVDGRRAEAGAEMDGERRRRLGQFLTPAPVAVYMASLIQTLRGSVRILDPGAGIGTLVAAAIDELCDRASRPSTIEVTAIEIDASLRSRLEHTLIQCERRCEAAGVRFRAQIVQEDFIGYARQTLETQMSFDAISGPRFDLAILNPPYRKIRADSTERRTLERLGVETTNLYSAFLALAALMLVDRGQLVAITPRSFCNGPYFRSFRRLFLREMTFTRIHVVESRNETFSEDDVLQENIVFHAERARRTGPVIVTTGQGRLGAIEFGREVDYHALVSPDDPDAFIHLVPEPDGHDIAERMRRLPCTLEDLGVSVSTGRVVDFRARQHLRPDPVHSTVPLIYPAHFESGFVRWPKHGKKPNAIVHTAETANLLVPSSRYVLVKRFSAKEERRRIVAAVYDDARLPPFDAVGFENHLNYFHRNGGGLEADLSRGLAAFLNSSRVDQFFRQFSGHTQVNAKDLRKLRYPALTTLRELGSRIDAVFPAQSDLDYVIEQVLA